MNAPSIKVIREIVADLSDDMPEEWKMVTIKEALRMIVDRLEALEKQNGDDHG